MDTHLSKSIMWDTHILGILLNNGCPLFTVA
jgi:hypothetical protein